MAEKLILVDDWADVGAKNVDVDAIEGPSEFDL